MLRKIERLAGAWHDSEHAVTILLVLFVAAWTGFHIVSNLSVGLHPDPLEVFDWSRHPAPGYSKHPPLGALMVAAWFAVFPVADWAFYLFAMVNAALGLFCIDLIARRTLAGDKRLFVLLLLLLTPFYQFQAVRFASNQVLLLTWPLATYCFLRAFERRDLAWSIAAGGAAALAMLGKYFSIYLIASFAVAALAHPDRWRYLRSGSPFISAAAGLLVLAPHIYWLMNTGYQPFSYALIAHGGSTLAGALAANAEYVLGALGYMALPVAVYWLALRPARATWRDALWPPEPDRRMLVLLLATPLVLPALTAPLIEAKLTAIWTIQGWFLLPIVLLAPSSARLPRRVASAVALAIAGLTLALLIAAPAIAWSKHKQGTNEGRNYFPALGQEVTRRWRAITGRRLSIMLGDQSLSTAFYSADHPDTVPGFYFWAAPWVTPQRLAREGWAAVCALDEPWCVAGAAQRIADNPAAQRFQFDIVPRFFGKPAAPRSFVLVVVPPRP